MTAIAVYLRSVDLPPMFGPVTSSIVWPFDGAMSVSFGTNCLVSESDTHGCLSYLISSKLELA